MTHDRTSTELSLSQAAKATGKSKSTINRAIKSGRLSAKRNDNGSYSIDAAELSRAFQIEPSKGSEWHNPEPPLEPAKIAALEAENAALHAALDREREALDEMRTDRDAWKHQATALLAAPSKRRSWWPWRR